MAAAVAFFVAVAFLVAVGLGVGSLLAAIAEVERRPRLSERASRVDVTRFFLVMRDPT